MNEKWANHNGQAMYASTTREAGAKFKAIITLTNMTQFAVAIVSSASVPLDAIVQARLKKAVEMFHMTLRTHASMDI